MRARVLVGGVAAVIAGVGVAATAEADVSSGRIVAEWEPGIAAAEAGGRLTVDGYGVGGLGFYALGGSGTTALAVCVQADVGHSLTAEYTIDAEPAVRSPELDYLLWRYAGPGGGAPAGDVVAAAVNVLSWRFANAQRSTGGPVWRGSTVEVGVVGRGRLPDVEAAVAELAAEAMARRGPWTLRGLEISVRPDGGADVTVRLAGPGGPIAAVDVTFELATERLQATTNADGVAAVEIGGPVSGLVRATTTGPGPARTYSAHGSQRLAVPTPVTISAERTIAPPSTTTTTTAPPTTSTAPPATTTTSTTLPPTTPTTTAPSPLASPTAPPATTTTAGPPSRPTTAPTTSTTTTAPAPTSPPSSTPPRPVPAPPTAAPPTLPRTGSSGGAIARWASWSFLAGSLAVLAAGPSRGSRRPRRPGTGRVAR